MWLLLACTGPETKSEVPFAGLYDADPLNPFPSVELVADGHLAIPEGVLPVPEGAPRWTWRG